MKTLALNVRSALQQAQLAWADIEQGLIVQRSRRKPIYVKAQIEMREALEIIFIDKKMASYFKETVKARYPQLTPLIKAYKQEIEKNQAWLKVNTENEIHCKLDECKSIIGQIERDLRKSSPALNNHMSALEGIFLEAKKEGYTTPTDSYEHAPAEWLTVIENLEANIHDAASRTNWLSLFGATKKGMLKEVKLIERRTKEGWPTIFLHAKQSLSLHQRLLSQKNSYERQSENAMALLMQYSQNTGRLADLQLLGEGAYIVAHADASAIQQLAQCLDTDVVGTAAITYADAYAEVVDLENTLTEIVATLQSWVVAFTHLEKQIDSLADATDVVHETSHVHTACTTLRRTVTYIQQWFRTTQIDENSNTSSSKTPIISLVKQGNVALNETLQTFNKHYKDIGLV